MRVIVVGLGSMGRRRIRLIRQYNPEIQIIGIDLNEERCNAAEKEWEILTAHSIKEALASGEVKCAFISTAPLSHADIITECLRNGLHVFTELNLVDTGYEVNIALAKKNNLVLFLSSTFLYRPEIKFINDKVGQSEKKINYHYHVGQYLPDWHPWEDYRNYFVGNKQTNGCREILAIELPWLTEVFGDIKDLKVLSGRMTDLDIDYDDHCLIMIEHQNGNKGQLGVDIVSRKAVRNLEVYGEDLYIEWNGSPSGLFEYDINQKASKNIKTYNNDIDHLDNYSSFVVENAYYDEIVNFFYSMDGAEIPRYSFEKDKKVLQVIERIERGGEN